MNTIIANLQRALNCYNKYILLGALALLISLIMISGAMNYRAQQINQDQLAHTHYLAQLSILNDKIHSGLADINSITSQLTKTQLTTKHCDFSSTSFSGSSAYHPSNFQSRCQNLSNTISTISNQLALASDGSPIQRLTTIQPLARHLEIESRHLGAELAQGSQHAQRDANAWVLVTIAVALMILLALLQRILTLYSENQKRAHMQLKADPLTGLLNRNEFRNLLNKSFSNCWHRNQPTQTLLLINVDSFKDINDVVQDLAGDDIIKTISTRIESVAASNAIVGRLCSDEFAVLYEFHQRPNMSAREAAERIQCQFLKPITSNGMSIYLSVSIGIALRHDSDSASALMSKSDLALQKAKQKGKANICFFRPELERMARQRLELDSELRNAIKNKEFCLNYQPIMNLSNGEITGAEALIRWQKGPDCIIPPNDFLPYAEATGLIIPIGEWVIETAIEQCKRWREHEKNFVISINLSVKQLKDEDLVPLLVRNLRTFDLPAKAIVLEITESLMVDNDPTLLRNLDGLRSQGIELHMDDFGVGYSSFSHLQQLPFSLLKIDRSFVRPVPGCVKTTLLASIIEIGRSLSLKVTAEGVETAESLTFLKSTNCQYAQGFHIGKPMAPYFFADFMHWQHMKPAHGSTCHV